MLKLKKTKSTEWLGNGMGTDTAEWVVKGHEHIAVLQLGMDWYAIDRSQETFKRMVSAWTRKELVERLSKIL